MIHVQEIILDRPVFPRPFFLPPDPGEPSSTQPDPQHCPIFSSWVHNHPAFITTSTGLHNTRHTLTASVPPPSPQIGPQKIGGGGLQRNVTPYLQRR